MKLISHQFFFVVCVISMSFFIGGALNSSVKDSDISKVHANTGILHPAPSLRVSPLNKRDWFSFKSTNEDLTENEVLLGGSHKSGSKPKGGTSTKVMKSDDEEDDKEVDMSMIDEEDCEDYDEIIDADDEDCETEKPATTRKKHHKSVTTTTYINWDTSTTSFTVTKHRKQLVPTTIVTTVTNYKWKKLPYTETLTETKSAVDTTTETFVDVDCKTSTATITRVATIPESWLTSTDTETATVYKYKVKYKPTTVSTSTTTTTTETSSIIVSTNTTTIVATSTTTTTSISTTTTTTIGVTTTVTFPGNGFLTSELGNLLTRLIPRGYEGVATSTTTSKSSQHYLTPTPQQR